MSIVGSWIDDEELAALMERIAPSGPGRVAPDAPGAADAAPGTDGLTLDPGCVQPRPDRVTLEPARRSKPLEDKPAETEPVGTGPAKTEPVGTGPAKTEPVGTGPAKTEPVGTGPAKAGPADSAAAREAAAPDVAKREVPPVSEKLAAIVARASASGLLKAGSNSAAADPGPAAAIADDGSKAPGAVEAATLGGRLALFAKTIGERYRCVRVLVVDSRGYSLLGTEKAEEALVATALTLSQSWVSCRKHLRLKEKGALSAVLGKGYRLTVIPCETELGFLTMGIVTRCPVKDEEIEGMRGELAGMIGG